MSRGEKIVILLGAWLCVALLCGIAYEGAGWPVYFGAIVGLMLWVPILDMELQHPRTIEAFLDRAFAHRIIPNCDGDPYLLRWYVFKTKWVTLFIHKFIRSDEDRALHDHPWSFLVIPIWRGYIEHAEVKVESKDIKANLAEWVAGKRIVSRRVLPILGTRLRPGTYRHRVELLQRWKDEPSSWCLGRNEDLPAWSLFFHFPKVRDWGFWTAEGFVKGNIWGRDHKCVE